MCHCLKVCALKLVLLVLGVLNFETLILNYKYPLIVLLFELSYEKKKHFCGLRKSKNYLHKYIFTSTEGQLQSS